MIDDADFDAWVSTVPADITADPIWRTPAYRFSLYLFAKVQDDLALIARLPKTRALGDQLLRSIGSISANLDEGYSRSSGTARAHFYEYALGSTREGRGWYWKCAPALPPRTLAARLALLSRIVRILTAVIPRERAMGKGWRRQRDQSIKDAPAATSRSSQQTADEKS